MKVELYAPFLLARRRSIRSALGTALQGDEGGDSLAFDRHTSSIQRLTRRLHEEELELDGHGHLRLFVNEIGVGTLFLQVEVTDREELHALEAELLPLVNKALADYCARVDAQQKDDVPTVPSSYLGHSRALWWHRILLLPDDDAPRALRLFGEGFQINDKTSGLVANGFTSISSDDGYVDELELREVATGLVTATEEWLLVDELSRELTGLLVQNEPGEQARRVETDRVVLRARHLTGEVALAVLVIDERRRHMANSSLRVHLAAATCWRLDSARDALVGRAETIQALVRMDQQAVAARVDESRNRILYGFTVVTVLQSLMLIAEFAVGQDLQVLSQLRLTVAVLMLSATVYVLVRYVQFGAATRGGQSPVVVPGARWSPSFRR